MNAVVDLSAIVPQDTADIEILKPGGTEGTGWIITMAGPSHPKAVAYANDQARRNLREQNLIKAAQVNGKKYKPDEKSPDEQRVENVKWIVSHIVDWTPVSLGGDPIQFSEKAATDLLLKREMGWAFIQLVEFLNDDRSFTKRSETISEPSQDTSSA